MKKDSVFLDVEEPLWQEDFISLANYHLNQADVCHKRCLELNEKGDFLQGAGIALAGQKHSICELVMKCSNFRTLSEIHATLEELK